MQRIDAVPAVVVTQIKEWGEILSGFELRNRYTVRDTNGADLFHAVETKNNFLARLILRSLRPFEIELRTPEQSLALRLRRPFRFYFHELEIVDTNGSLLGSLKREFSFLRRIYTVRDAQGGEAYRLFGPLLHPWTFNIERGGAASGKITKKWSGLLKEVFADADNFGIEFPTGASLREKALLLGAVFLIDFVHFENNNNR